MQTTLYWHDYETFGIDPRRDRPAQFAGLRTDLDLNEISEPLVRYCRPTPDRLPSPEACLITGITPQTARDRGLPEARFIADIHHELAHPGTCGVGYNSCRFDDEVTRHGLYRNLFDPYAREWRHGNSRWDIIDLVRMTHALRPQGIEWPRHDDGRPSFRLEDLAAANHLLHEAAHDALSDVRATIGLARLLKDRQPRLYRWLFELRDKHKAGAQLDLERHTPVIHSSRMYPSETGCTSLVMPLAPDPNNPRGVLVYDLRHDPAPFLGLDVATLRERLYTPAADLPEGVERLPVKSVKTNKCPALAPRKTLDPESARRIRIDLTACKRHWEVLADEPDLPRRIAAASAAKAFEAEPDVDAALYDGFIPETDRSLLDKVRATPPDRLGRTRWKFRDPRLPELLFRYRARNWPETLSEEETRRWRDLCRTRLEAGDANGAGTLAGYRRRIAELRDERADDPRAEAVLNALRDWGTELART